MSSDDQNTIFVSTATITTMAGVLYHALEGAAVYDQAIADAQRAGNQELITFLQQVQQQDQQRAAQARQLIGLLSDGPKGNGDISRG
jgi:hypothetical protein